MYAKGCDDVRQAPLAAEDHLGMDQVMIYRQERLQEEADKSCHQGDH